MPNAKTKSKESASIPTFEASLPMALLRARDAAMMHFRPVFTEADLTEQQWRVLRALYDESSVDISSLAKTCHILLPSMTGILKRLEARGLIKRSANQNDQRSSVVAITQKAKTLIRSMTPHVEERYKEIQTLIGKKQLEHLYVLLAELEENLQDRPN